MPSNVLGPPAERGGLHLLIGAPPRSLNFTGAFWVSAGGGTFLGFRGVSRKPGQAVPLPCANPPPAASSDPLLAGNSLLPVLPSNSDFCF